MEIYIAKNKTQMGPYDAGQITQMVKSGLLLRHDLYWHEGMDEWAPIAGLKMQENQSQQQRSYMEQHTTAAPVHVMYPPIAQGGFYNQGNMPIERKSRATYILLGLFLGGLGIHNFYAGYSGRGISQLLITLLTGWLFFPLFFVFFWVVVEVCIETKDANGIPFS